MPPPEPRPATQHRSRATLERLLAATEALLAERDFAAITVQDIVERASSSVGSFYKRFNSKDDLLPYLLNRIQERQHAALETQFAPERWRGRPLEVRIRSLMHANAAHYKSHRHLVRVLVLRQFLRPDDYPAIEQQRARALIDRLIVWLLECREEIAHDDPKQALEVGLFAAITSLQVALLFRPKTRRIGDDILVAELASQLLTYLTQGAARADQPRTP